MRSVPQASGYGSAVGCRWVCFESLLEVCECCWVVEASVAEFGTPVGEIVLERRLVDEDHVGEWGCGEEFGVAPVLLMLE